jgi:RNAse (barnase) inhibitor barstar
MSQSITLSLIGINNEEDFHDRVISAFSFPSYYGRNQDAFWDCLTDLAGKKTVRIIGLSGLSGDLRSTVNSYMTMLRDYAIKTDGQFMVVVD